MRDLLLIAVSAAAGGILAYLVLRARAAGRPRSAVRSGGIGGRTREQISAAEVLERMGEGVLILDHTIRPTFANSAARDMLGFQGPGLPDRLPSLEVAGVAGRAADEGDVEQRIDVLFPLPMTLKVRATTLEHGGEVLVVLKDLTQETLAQRVRREFVAHASHELKSPVAGLQALAEAMRHAVKDDPESAEGFSERMVREADRLGRLVRDLLDLSRLEEDVPTPSELIELSEVARRALEQVDPAAEAKEMDVASAISDGVWVKGDEEQLGLMIRNLLENAIRYTPKFGSIRLKLARREEEATVSVSDSGIGIPREAHARVFERFYRVDRARSRDRGGTGLGLAIVKHVAELHGGRVELESELGEGSTFTVYVPAVAADKTSLESVAS